MRLIKTELRDNSKIELNIFIYFHLIREKRFIVKMSLNGETINHSNFIIYTMQTFATMHDMTQKDIK
jgi:hypothetical protein